jgi:hypothetical protein
MGTIHGYLELHRGLRSILVLAAFLLASSALYLVVAIWLVGVPGTTPNFSADFMLPSSCLLLALTCDFVIASLLHQPGQRAFWISLAIASGAIIVGATFVSVAIWRAHWFELVKEIFGTTR